MSEFEADAMYNLSGPILVRTKSERIAHAALPWRTAEEQEAGPGEVDRGGIFSCANVRNPLKERSECPNSSAVTATVLKLVGPRANWI